MKPDSGPTASTFAGARSSLRWQPCGRSGALGELSTIDGPFIETKELLGGFILLDAPDLATAVAMAADWPAFGTDGNAVEVRPTDATSA